MKKVLIAYFSASGNTKKIAEKIANAGNFDIFEIKPELPYTDTDLNWHDHKSRSFVEMNETPDFRPKISNKVDNMQQYDALFIGFPIWWDIAPTIVNSFLESYNLSGKKIVLFITSGSNKIGNIVEKLAPSAKEARFIAKTRFEVDVSQEEINNWVNKLNIR